MSMIPDDAPYMKISTIAFIQTSPVTEIIDYERVPESIDASYYTRGFARGEAL